MVPPKQEGLCATTTARHCWVLGRRRLLCCWLWLAACARGPSRTLLGVFLVSEVGLLIEAGRRRIMRVCDLLSSTAAGEQRAVRQYNTCYAPPTAITTTTTAHTHRPADTTHNTAPPRPHTKNNKTSNTSSHTRFCPAGRWFILVTTLIKQRRT